MVRLFIDWFRDMILAVLAGDLLYLYHIGGWTDPTPWIRAAEVVSLYVIGAGGLALAVSRVVFFLRKGG